MSSGKPKGAFTKYSITAVLILVAALAQEFISLARGLHGGAFSHIVWWAAGDLYSWRWAIVLAPIVGTLLWAAPHFIWQWGTGVHLLWFIGVTFLVLAVLVLIH